MLIVAFFLTSGMWYAPLSTEQKVQFWNEFGVAYGTLALAVVTWASVYETQQVLADEDLRFRRARMPVVVVLYARPSDEGGFEIALENIGEGAARDVYLSFSAHVRVAWNQGGLADQRDQIRERDHHAKEHLVTSYLGPGRNVSIVFDKPARPDWVMNPEITALVKQAEIAYVDVFESSFMTCYDIRDGEPFDALRFRWTPPAILVD